MRDSFTSSFKLFVSRMLTSRSPTWLSFISSQPVTSIFCAITGPCTSKYIALTGDLDLYERTLYHILQNNTSFPVLEDIFYHCSPPISYSTGYTYCYIPTSFQPPVHLPISYRTINIYIDMPMAVRVGRDVDVRHYHVSWDLHVPSHSTVYWGSGEPSRL